MISKFSLITLTTDFGLNDPYVGVMKGVMKKINPELNFIDITHNIPPQNIIAGRFCLMNSIPYFPDETIHLAVVDPGVGSQRRGIIMQFDQGYLIAPDNGLISGIINLYKHLTVIEIKNPQYWLSKQPSLTFHGRDIFAPVAAYLAQGIPLTEFGDVIDPASLIKVNFPDYQLTNNRIIGYIQYIDHFGNLITNIPASIIQQKSWVIIINNYQIYNYQTYSDVKQGHFLALIGSHGWLEIAINQGNAQKKLNTKMGDPVNLSLV